MNKCLVLVGFCVLALSGCTDRNEQYYRSNLKELQQALKDCPQKQPKGVTCQQIEGIASHMHQLANQLQYNPQEFGTKIITLQQAIVSVQLALEKNGDTTDLQTQLKEKKQALADHLAVVTSSEPPES